MKKEFVITSLLLILITCVSAHQPRLVYDKFSSIDSPFIINNPEISQAFYGELKGQPEYFVIESEKEFEFYLGMLAPDVEGAKTDFVFEVFYDNESLKLEKADEWERFYEEFAGDDYLEGPELTRIMGPGEYIIRVSNIDNQGKYVLVVGKIESFPLKETINTYLALPRLKIYFEKSPLTAYFNLISIPLWIILVILIVIVIYLKRRKNKRKKQR